MSWTVLVKSPVIPQWADFSVTAPSGLVPWPAFYDGTEVVTVSWGGAIPPMWGVYPWFQLNRNIFYSWSSNARENRFQWMFDAWSNIIYFFNYRYDFSDDYTKIFALVLDKSNFNLSWASSQSINNLSSWWNPFGVQQWHYNNISRDGWNNIKYIRWLSGADWEVIYSIAWNSRSWYTYTRNSNNKIPYTNPIPSNWFYTIWSLSTLMTMFVNNNAWANFLDPYLEIH